MTEKVLLVDDEPNVLRGYERHLRKRFQLTTATSGAEGLETLRGQGPFAVVVSDMRMPGMDGVEFLSKARELAPQTVRIMLTGCAEQQVAIEAVNEGCIFRFLNKPCEPEMLAKALEAGIEQYRLITAEKELLEKTLRGAVKVLAEVLSLANPTAFGHASRVRRLVQKLCQVLKVRDAWQVEIAAMLSQIGCVTVPPGTLEKAYHGQELTPAEQQMIAAHPEVGRTLVAHIPRLEGVAEIIAYQLKNYDGSGLPADGVAGDRIPYGARILRVAQDYDQLKWSGLNELDVLLTLSKRAGRYDPTVLAALKSAIGLEEQYELRQVAPAELNLKMILAEDVLTSEGMLLVGKGQEVTLSLRERLLNFARNGRLAGPIRVLVRTEGRTQPKKLEVTT